MEDIVQEALSGEERSEITGDGRREPTTSTRTDATTERTRYLVVGCGGAGCTLADAIARATADVHALGVDTDATQLTALELADALRWVHAADQPRDDSGVSDARSRTDRSDPRAELEGTLDGADLCLAVVGLAGETGAHVSRGVVELASDTDATVLVLALLPFAGERSDMEAVATTLERLEPHTDGILAVDNAYVQNRHGLDDPLTGADYAKVNAYIASLVSTLFDIVLQPSLMNVKLADIEATLQESSLGLLRHYSISSESTELSTADDNDALCEGLPAPMATDVSRRCLLHLTVDADTQMADVASVAQRVRDRLTPANEELLLRPGVRIEEFREAPTEVLAIAGGYELAELWNRSGTPNERTEDRSSG